MNQFYHDIRCEWWKLRHEALMMQHRPSTESLSWYSRSFQLHFLRYIELLDPHGLDRSYDNETNVNDMRTMISIRGFKPDIYLEACYDMRHQWRQKYGEELHVASFPCNGRLSYQYIWAASCMDWRLHRTGQNMSVKNQKKGKWMIRCNSLRQTM